MLLELAGLWPPRRLGDLRARAPRRPRPATPAGATLLFAGHSFVQTPYGDAIPGQDQHGGILYTDWPGTTLSDYVAFGSTRAVWDLDDDLRHSAYDVVIASEVAEDLQAGYPPPDTPRGIETLQYLRRYAQAAALRGAELVLMQTWEGPLTGAVGAAMQARFEYDRRWLAAELGRPVWVIPAGVYVAALRVRFGDMIFEDGLHLDRASRFPRGLSYLVYSFLTQDRCPFVRPGDADIDELAWQTLLDWECAGMGGSLTITPTAVATPPVVPA